MRTPRPDLSPDQIAEAERIYEALRRSSEDEHWQIAQLLASKPDGQLLGRTEFEVRDLTHKTGAKAIQAALDGRKKGGTGGPAWGKSVSILINLTRETRAPVFRDR